MQRVRWPDIRYPPLSTFFQKNPGLAHGLVDSDESYVMMMMMMVMMMMMMMMAMMMMMMMAMMMMMMMMDLKEGGKEGKSDNKQKSYVNSYPFSRNNGISPN